MDELVLDYSSFAQSKYSLELLIDFIFDLVLKNREPRMVMVSPQG